MEKTIFNNNIKVILFNKPSSQVIYSYINQDKTKFKQVINNKLLLLINKYKLLLLNMHNYLNPRVPGENNNITYLKKYIMYLNIIINNNYTIPINEINTITSILNDSINIFLDKLKIKTIDSQNNLSFYKNNYNKDCWINYFIQILGCQPVFSKHFEKYVKQAYTNYIDSTKNKLQLTKMNITQPEYNYIFNSFPLYNYDILQNIFENQISQIINFNKHIILPENIKINIIEPYYILPVYNHRKYYKFDKSGYCINDDQFIRIYNISDVLIDGNFYYVIKNKNNVKLFIHIDDIKSKKLLEDLLKIYVCMVYNDYYYLLENNESLCFNSLTINTQKDIDDTSNCIKVNNISSIFFDNNTFNSKKYAYCKVKEYINCNSNYTPFNKLNISNTFLSLSSMINEYYKKNNDILYIVSYNIIKIFKDTVYKKKLNILLEPLFYVIDLLNEYSNFNIPLCQSPDPLNSNKNEEFTKINKSISLNNLNNDFEKINKRNKSLSYTNLNNVYNTSNINTIHNFLLNYDFYNLFNR